MTAEALVRQLEERGVRVTVDGPDLVVRPAASCSAEDVDALRTQKTEVLALLRARTLGVDWFKVSLYKLDRVIEVAVPSSDTNIIIAPGCRIARDLRATDSMPGRIWCVCEIIDLLLSGVTAEDVRAVVEARLLFDAEQLGVRKTDSLFRDTQ